MSDRRAHTSSLAEDQTIWQVQFFVSFNYLEIETDVLFSYFYFQGQTPSKPLNEFPLFVTVY